MSGLIGTQHLSHNDQFVFFKHLISNVVSIIGIKHYHTMINLCFNTSLARLSQLLVLNIYHTMISVCFNTSSARLSQLLVHSRKYHSLIQVQISGSNPSEVDIIAAEEHQAYDAAQGKDVDEEKEFCYCREIILFSHEKSTCHNSHEYPRD